MYNKLFTKILDSSIWLESTPTRIVWLTFIAVMDETGFAQFASIRNVAHRARVTDQEAEEAIKALEGPDPVSSDPDNDGRRLERVPGGWIVLNADKHRKLVSKIVVQEQTKERVKRFRDKKKAVTQSNGSPLNVTPSEARSVVHTEISDSVQQAIQREKASTTTQTTVSLSPAAPTYSNPNTDPFLDQDITRRAAQFIDRYQELYPERRNGARYAVRPVRDYAAAVTLCQTWVDDVRLEKLAVVFLTTDHKFAEEGSRTIPQFLALASWCDGKLAEWEQTHGRQSTGPATRAHDSGGADREGESDRARRHA